MIERWLPVIGYEGWYEVSDQGRIKRVGRGRGVKNPILNPYAGKNGYRGFFISHGKADTRKRVYVHRLVAAAFLARCPAGHEVNHKDGVKTNNAATNLEYVTAAGNTRHAAETGLMSVGSKHPISVLTEADVVEMRRLAPRLSHRRIALMFGVSPGAAYAAITGRTWRHVKQAPVPRTAPP